MLGNNENRFFKVFLVSFLVFSMPGNVFALKICSTCKASFDDNVNFCPFDGKPLKVDKSLPEGKLEIEVYPPNASIQIDGINRGKGPVISLTLPIGEHRIEAIFKGFSTQKLKVFVNSGQSQKLSLELSPENFTGSPFHTDVEMGRFRPDGEGFKDPSGVPKPGFPESIPKEKHSRNPDFSNMIEIRSGSYLLGSERGNFDERPLRRVKTPGFLIDRFEVTCSQYQKFLDSVKKNGHLWCHPSESAHKDHTPFHTYAWALKFSWLGGKPPPGQADFPVVLCDWFDAYACANWMGKRLPTEDEWEIAAGGGDNREYPWGNTFNSELCNVSGTLIKVGSYPEGRSPWGVEDMAGSIAEWTSTVYEADSRDGKPFGGKFGQPIIRGGSWDDESKGCRISARDVRRAPFYRSTTVGFRCVADKPTANKR